MLNLGQNEYIKNLLLQRILSSEITFYEFLRENMTLKMKIKLEKLFIYSVKSLKMKI